MVIDATNAEVLVDSSNVDWVSGEHAYTVALEEDEDGSFVASIPTLRGCISQGDTRQEALDHLADALKGWLEVAERRGLDVPPPP